MNVAHEVVVGRRCVPSTLSSEPQSVDPTTLLRPMPFGGTTATTTIQTTPNFMSTTLEPSTLPEPTPIQTSITVVEEASTAHDIRPTSSSSPARESGHRRKCSSEDGIHFVDDDDGIEFQLDARHLNRVHEELEKLNIATDVINKLELQLDYAREKFRQVHSEWSKRSDEIQRKYDSAIKKSRPYYDAIREEQRLREQAQSAAIRFERANTMLQVAKQQVKLTQDSLTRQKNVEPECLEVLNHHVQRVNEAEQKRLEAEQEHCQLSQQMIQCTQRVKQLLKDNGRSIKKAKHYFEMHKKFKKELDEQKQLISSLESSVKQKKRDYTSSLRNLEQISDSIHEERSLTSSTKHSARTPDSARKSVSAVGLSKLQTSDVDDTESALGDLDDDAAYLKRNGVRRSKQSTISSLTSGGADSHSTTSSSSGGISMNQPDTMLNDLCADEMPESLIFDEDYDYKLSADVKTLSLSTNSQHHGRSISELSAISDGAGSTKRQMGSGVILLAQRLMNGNQGRGASAKGPISSRPHSREDNDDFSYRTAPLGIDPVQRSSDSAPQITTNPSS